MPPKPRSYGVSLADQLPELAAEWHPTKNGRLTPREVALSSTALVYWRCSRDRRHVWRAQVRTRSTRRECPVCTGHAPGPDTSLARRLPEIAARWHATKNGDLRPTDVLPQSGKRVWWQCPHDARHSFQRPIQWVTVAKTFQCPLCGRVRAPKGASLATRSPAIAKEWVREANVPATPSDVAATSKKVATWRCSRCAHIFRDTVHARATLGRGCPVCARTRLATHRSLAALHPDLAAEWHPSKNRSLGPSDVRPGSHRHVHWRCSKDPSHEWRAQLKARSGLGTGCPYCAGGRVLPERSLASLHPDVAREWDAKRNRARAQATSPGSSRKAWWRCSRDRAHRWEAAICDRTRARPTGCPYCSNRRVAPGQSLREVMPDLARQWHRAKNRPLTPDDVSTSHARSVWWRCAASHEWRAPVRDRARGVGCPACARADATPARPRSARSRTQKGRSARKQRHDLS